MAKDKSPAYQWYPKDILGSIRVAMMSLAEEGAYRRALDYCWLNGSLPADSKMIAKIVGKGCTDGMAKKIIPMFEQANGVLVHERLESERIKQSEWREKSKQGGIKSAEARANQLSTTHEPPLQIGSNQSPTLHSSSPSSIAIDTKVSKRVRKTFVPPSSDEVVEYFKENGYNHVLANMAFRHYDQGNWSDSKGNPVRNWKQKCLNWFTEKNATYLIAAPTLKMLYVRSLDNPNPHYITEQRFSECVEGYYTIIKQ